MRLLIFKLGPERPEQLLVTPTAHHHGVETSENPVGNLLEFQIPSGNTGNLMEFNCYYWKFLYNRSMIDDYLTMEMTAVKPKNRPGRGT